MDLSFKNLCREQLDAVYRDITHSFSENLEIISKEHSKEIQTFKTTLEQEEDKLDSLQKEKQKIENKYLEQLLEVNLKYKNLQAEVNKKNNTDRDSNQTCGVCKSLQKSLDALRDFYSQSLQEKDRIIELLDSKLCEYTGGESLLANLQLNFSTPKKLSNQKGNRQKQSSDKEQSTDCTITSRKSEDESGLVFDQSSETSTNGNFYNSLDKGPKLRLQRGQKRHRFTEVSVSQRHKRKRHLENKDTLENKANATVIVPETCDFNETNNEQEGKSCIEDGNKSTAKNNSPFKQTKKLEKINIQDDVRTVPETVNVLEDMFGSSGDDELDRSIVTQDTVKEVKGHYSLLGVLCSPSTSDDEVDSLPNMENVVNHKTMHLSGNSLDIMQNKSRNNDKSKYINVNPAVNESKSCSQNEVNFALSRKVKLKLSGQQILKSLRGSSQKHSTDPTQSSACKPNENLTAPKTSPPSGIQNSYQNNNSRFSQKNHKVPFRTTPENVNIKNLENDECFTVSPVFNVGKNSKICNRQESPMLLMKNKVRGHELDQQGSPGLLVKDKARSPEQPESPLLLRVSSVYGSQGDHVMTLSSGSSCELVDKSQSPAFDPEDLNEDESPIILRRTKSCTSAVPRDGDGTDLKSTYSQGSPGKKVSSPWKRATKQKKGSKIKLTIDFDQAQMSLRNLRQTTLSQVFNQSPPKQQNNKNKTLSQEEQDIQTAIEISLKESKDPKGKGHFRRSKINLNDTDDEEEHNLLSKKLTKKKGEKENTLSIKHRKEDKENTPPFKIPVTPSRRVKGCHISGEHIEIDKNKGRTVKVLPDLECTVLDFDETLAPSKQKLSSSQMLYRHKSKKDGVEISVSPGKDQNNKFEDGSSPSANEKGFSKHLNIFKGSACSKEKSPSNMYDSSANVRQNAGNGSLDPAIQLSQLCGESQHLLNDVSAIEPCNGVIQESQINEDLEEGDFSQHEIAPENTNSHSIPTTLNDSVATLRDFRIDDLKRGVCLTSTCVEDDSQSIPCSGRSVKFGSGKKKLVLGGNRGMTVQDAMDIPNTTLETEKPDVPPQTLEDSFDRLPKPKEDSFAYIDVVRKQHERRQLKAYDCKECYEYYKCTGLSDEEIKKRVQDCSKHRARYVPPSTPEHFWSVGFPDTQECEERGYINEEIVDQEDKPVFRRKRRLRKIFRSKNETHKESDKDISNEEDDLDM